MSQGSQPRQENASREEGGTANIDFNVLFVHQQKTGHRWSPFSVLNLAEKGLAG